MRTNNEIKNKIYNAIKGTDLYNEIIGKGGRVYKESRPSNSNKEDIVISVLSNQNAMYQPAIVNVNIYVPDIQRGNDFIENEQRVSALSKLSVNLFKEIVSNDCLIRLDKLDVFKLNEIHEHCVNNRLILTILNL